MTHTAHPSVVIAEAARQRADRAEAVKQAWRDGTRPDAAAALGADPDLAADKAAALDLAYEEYCAREEAGEVLDSATFCARFPFGASLRRLLTVHRFLDDHPDALGDVPVLWPEPGDAVGDFLLLRELGRGSFARVYLAVETTAGDRPVALKVSAAGSREADTLGPLSHPHLIPVLSSRRIDAWTVVAMPFAGTATLEDVLSAAWPAGAAPPRSAAVLLEAAGRGGRPDDPPFPARPAFPVHAGAAYGDAVAAVAAGLFAAVAHLHARGIAHRDVKPSNVLLGPTGHPYLLDFNLASRAADPWRLVGTLPYMAPEQLAPLAKDADPPADGRPADVFACGVVLFELLTGRHPFGDPAALSAHPDRNKVAAALLAAQRAGHPALGGLNPRVRTAVRRVVERCLALDPRKRPTAAELAELFARAGARRRRYVAPALAGAAALVLALGYLAFGRPTPVPDAPPAPPADAPVPAVAAPAPPAPPTPITRFERGLALVRQQGDMKRAPDEFIADMKRAAGDFIAAGKAGSDGRAYGYAAYCLSVGKEPSGAIAAADAAIRLGYRTAPVYANRAYNHLHLARLPKAKEDCDEALRLDPDLLAARYSRAYAHLQMRLQNGEGAVPPEAIADVDRVTASEPTDPDVWNVAAQLYVLAPGGPAMDKAAHAVRKAVRAGKPPDALRRSEVLRPLAGHPIYEEALTLLPGRAVKLASPHLVNPIP